MVPLELEDIISKLEAIKGSGKLIKDIFIVDRSYANARIFDLSLGLSFLGRVYTYSTKVKGFHIFVATLIADPELRKILFSRYYNCIRWGPKIDVE